MRRWHIDNRKRAGLIIAASLPIMIIGGLLLPTEASPPPEASATTVARESTTTASSTMLVTTSTGIATTTSTPTVATAPAPLPAIPDADVVFAPVRPGPSGDPEAPPPPEATPATIVSITDGDTLDVAFSDATTDTVRLVGINSPEPGECFDEEASVVLSMLTPVGEQVWMTTDVSDRDQYDRLLRYLWVGDMSVNEEMVRRGAAIARRYPPDVALAGRLEQAQIAARDGGLGLWRPDACGPAAGTEIVVLEVEADAPGDDNQNLNAEWVRLRNDGELGVDLTGWVVKDESASNRYELPSGFTLHAGAILTLYTGCGAATATSLFWCAGGAVWNNDGDTAFILDQNGNTVDSLSYTPPTVTTSVEENAFSGGNCDSSYPDVCIPPPPPDLDCGQIPYRRFRVIGPDPHGFDGNSDGVGCES
jgi:micrococcal nuclease